MEHAVVGLSGGIDSSLSCYLAVKALGAANVLGVRMPYKTSSPDSMTDAQLMIAMLGIPSRTIEITPMADPLIALDPQMSAIRKGNIMARIRMVVLYDQSADFKGLVVGTGNKTEYLLGYTTLYGDSACAFNPLGDLYKTQVRQLAASFDFPQSIQSKAPSADLWKGQTDEGELGFTYGRGRQAAALPDRSWVGHQAMPGKGVPAGIYHCGDQTHESHPIQAPASTGRQNC